MKIELNVLGSNLCCQMPGDYVVVDTEFDCQNFGFKVFNVLG